MIVEPGRQINELKQKGLVPLGGERKSNARVAAEHAVVTIGFATGLVFPVVVAKGLAEAGEHYLKNHFSTRRN